MTGRPRRRPCLRLSASGYSIPDVYCRLDTALSCGLAEEACCLAAELAASPDPGEAGRLVDWLRDAFSSRYATVDGDAMARVASAFSRCSEGQLPAGHESRRALCELLISMSIGLPRHAEDSWHSIVARARAARGGSGAPPSPEAPPPAANIASLLQSMMSGRRASEAVVVAFELLDRACSSNAASAAATTLAVWDACELVSSSRRFETARAYVEAARSIFGKATKASLSKRRALILFSVLVASSGCGEGSQHPPRTWAGPVADVALSRACDAIDAIFERLMSHGPPPSQESASDHHSLQPFRQDGDQRSISYLRMYVHPQPETRRVGGSPPVPEAIDRSAADESSSRKIITLVRTG